MPTLDSTLRDLLATVIGKENVDDGARAFAAAGARAAIEALAVHLASPYVHQDDASKQLRNRVRARARQLGDVRYSDGRHEIERLVEQAAYEHWHRMLFARFLAENDLLIHPEMKVAVTLAECAEMAASEGATDGWELAGRYASRMLPQIFRPDDPLLSVRFALDDVRKLEDLLDRLPAELFRASDSLGWCYQFWQARKKKKVNASEVKIGADELPAVTQLFTEPYMVQFLLQNTLGAWWVGAGRTLPVEMPYLRRLDDGTPAAGIFEDWPRTVAELKVLDPCCGSGHFLVAAFEILVKFRMAEKGVDACEACDAVLRENLFGLEIDARCVQIAAFALAMAAWTLPGAGGYRPLAAMNVACSGLAITAKRTDWEQLGGNVARDRAGMARLWNLFNNAGVLGSLIDPLLDPPARMFTAGAEELRPTLETALSRETRDAELSESQVVAAGIAASAAILGQKFTLLATNVPYLLRRKQESVMQAYCDECFPDASANLSTSVIERALRMLNPGGTVAVVSPQNWLFAGSYEAFRRQRLHSQRWDILARLGAGAFETITGEIVDVTLSVMSNVRAPTSHTFFAIDATLADSAMAKANCIAGGATVPVSQSDLLEVPEARFVVRAAGEAEMSLLSGCARSLTGIQTGDLPAFTLSFWEIPKVDGVWEFYQVASSGEAGDFGMSAVVRWEGGAGRLHQNPGAFIRGEAAWGRRGVLVSLMRGLSVSPYFGAKYDQMAAAVIAQDDANAAAVNAFLSSESYKTEVRRLDKGIKVTPASLTKVPFRLQSWLQPSSSAPSQESHVVNPTQWMFAGDPKMSMSPLQVSLARLLGYRWPGQTPDSLDSHVDVDGIVCIPALRGERAAADRLSDLIATAWGKDWHPQVITDLLAAADHQGSLESWLRDECFKQHCECFGQRPFVWHIWDGHREGFSAFVNYHKLDHELLKSLTWAYLGDWIRMQEVDASEGRSGAGDKLAKSKILQQRLAAILEGESPLDVFVRWKPLWQQPTGWDPDIDDGVRLNIRPFMTVQAVGAKGAGVLRSKPNIKWGVDRGKNPEGSPWGEERDNDKHLTLADKRKARGQK